MMNRSVDSYRFKGHSIFGRGKRSSLVQSLTCSQSGEERLFSSGTKSVEGWMTSYSCGEDDEIKRNVGWFNDNYY